MTNKQKHFKAVHKESGEEIFFGLEDIESGRFTLYKMKKITWSFKLQNDYTSRDLEDYDLKYFHEGRWYSYGGDK